MKTGIVKFYDATKGFGFLICEKNNKEYFVHASGLIDEIKDGDFIEFDLAESSKGIIATKVKKT
ncbi:MAG: cold shock domain-containing protein [Flavobacteriales bacterium]|nr:cold shock domain-containing protein [Flavobacteriales bacterium]